MLILFRKSKVSDYIMTNINNETTTMDLKKLDDLEMIDKQQFQFISPFRCVLYG